MSRAPAYRHGEDTKEHPQGQKWSQFSGTSARQTCTTSIFHQQQSGWTVLSNKQASIPSFITSTSINKKNLVDLSVSGEKQTKIKILAFRLCIYYFFLRSSRLCSGKLLGYRIKLIAEVAQCNWINRNVLRPV